MRSLGPLAGKMLCQQDHSRFFSHWARNLPYLYRCREAFFGIGLEQHSQRGRFDFVKLS